MEFLKKVLRDKDCLIVTSGFKVRNITEYNLFCLISANKPEKNHYR